ncbi:Oligopeptide transport ATP-binding protein OppF [Pseudonocardia sp. Ae406_Ps2]|uniref:ABC transporter ATP-binding protein n=1 Tax=unclassified Pseudonocardia TaxID=2619320 RepID=UPI0009603FD9|nr:MULTISPECIES: ABC transporter ATP-binding protein [unclassified Pseudonocardia]OLL99845.1 Oligopeptide transport ATP-binding protein OppF [Pseudonocardia sp. Ae331_Ps2]OLM02405.1 Oligopeptide transport ATP-binding protein OppF [Pseudonocardia sp. Ae406_Ps2]OLM12759.1 Oligopeptide transport ATP-binding protein OppF [Pseudonocardia sp. Ae505_Ps2]OLM23976.1 Oligopeptide transport ATP-binding protein OppF [Pseudonocardia sp. Ae706_Ps2]
MRTENLQVSYRDGGGRPVRAVAGVDLDILEGETLGLVGESGCGKSTLGRALLRAVDPSGGRIHYRGRDITDLTSTRMRPLRGDMQMVFQDPFGSLNPRRTVADIVAEPLLRARGMSRGAAHERVGELLERVGLGRAAGSRRPHEFSGGQRQRIGIARALAPSPRFVVADEPVSALDVSIQAQVINLLTGLTRDEGLTLLFISHDLGVVRHIADRIALMYLGQIIEVAPRGAFFSAPAHPYGEALLSAVPVLERTRERIVLSGELPDPAAPPSGCRFRTRCRHAVRRCADEEPALRPIGEGRSVRCHLPLLDLTPPVPGPAAPAGSAPRRPVHP